MYIPLKENWKTNQKVLNLRLSEFDLQENVSKVTIAQGDSLREGSK